MVTSLTTHDRTEARKKGMMAIGAWGGAGLLVLVHWPWLGLAAAGGAGYLTYKWFMFRAKRGMRF
jgi:ABC-type uncharacterized transport system permease subunit